MLLRRALRALFQLIGVACMLVSLLMARLARAVMPITPLTEQERQRRTAEFLAAVQAITHIERSQRFVKAEMIDGPADGHGFPVDLDDPPPRVPYRTGQGIYWYLPERRSADTIVLKWDRKAPQPVA